MILLPRVFLPCRTVSLRKLKYIFNDEARGLHRRLHLVIDSFFFPVEILPHPVDVVTIVRDIFHLPPPCTLTIQKACL